MAFVLSKLLWALVSPGSLLTFMLIGGLALGLSSRPVLAKTGKTLCFATAFCLGMITVLPVGSWALSPLESRFTFAPPDHVDGIIIIGGDEQKEITAARNLPTALDSIRRYVMLAAMARRYPDAKLVFSGGSPFPYSLGGMMDSDIARSVMTDIGVPTDRMLIEKESRNTYENAVFSAALVHPSPSQKWLLVTSAWHMPRAIGCFRKAGWNISAAPTGYFTTGTYPVYASFRFAEQMEYLTTATHEYIGLAAYWIMGRTSALWPE